MVYGDIGTSPLYAFKESIHHINEARGGDLMLREKSSPSATEHNLTQGITQGQGDVSDPELDAALTSTAMVEALESVERYQITSCPPPVAGG